MAARDAQAQIAAQSVHMASEARNSNFKVQDAINSYEAQMAELRAELERERDRGNK